MRLRIGVLSMAGAIKKVMIRLVDVNLPAQSAQAAGEFSGVVEDLVDLKLAPFVETAAEHGGIRFWKAVVNCCRRVVVARIDEKYPPAWRETAADQRPEAGETLWGNVGEPEPKEHHIKLFGGLPLEQIRLDGADQW